MRPTFQLGPDVLTIQPKHFHSASSFAFLLESKDFIATVLNSTVAGSTEFDIELNGRTRRMHLARQHDTVFIHLDGYCYQLDQVDLLERLQSSASVEDVITSPMPGIAVEIRTLEGAAVSSGETLIVIESMKLLSEITAPRSGSVKSMHVAAGDSFEKGAVLVELEALETENTGSEA